MRLAFLFLIPLLFLFSCSSKFSLQKKRYSKGFYWAKSGGNTTKPKHENSVVHCKHENKEVEETVCKIVEQKTASVLSSPEVIAMTHNVLQQPVYIQARAAKTFENAGIVSKHNLAKKQWLKNFPRVMNLIGQVLRMMMLLVGLFLFCLGIFLAYGGFMMPMGLGIAFMGLFIAFVGGILCFIFILSMSWV